MYEYRCKVLKVVDGDTVDVDIDLGFGTWIHNERVRIMGIDTPESRTSNDIEKKFGLAAKERLKELLGETAILKTQIDKKSAIISLAKCFFIEYYQDFNKIILSDITEYSNLYSNNPNFDFVLLKTRVKLFVKSVVY